MKADPTAAQHLAELETRYDAHLTALRDHASLVQAAVESDAAALAERAAPAARPASAPEPEPHE